MMELHNCQWRLRMICCWSFRIGAEAFGMGRVSEWRKPREGENFGVVKASECGM